MTWPWRGFLLVTETLPLPGMRVHKRLAATYISKSAPLSLSIALIGHSSGPSPFLGASHLEFLWLEPLGQLPRNPVQVPRLLRSAAGQTDNRGRLARRSRHGILYTNRPVARRHGRREDGDTAGADAAPQTTLDAGLAASGGPQLPVRPSARTCSPAQPVTSCQTNAPSSFSVAAACSLAVAMAISSECRWAPASRSTST